MKILIVGAGIAGLSLLYRLKDTRFNIKIVEKNPELSQQGAGICLPGNAIAGFHELGLAEDILAISHRVSQIRYESKTGKLLSQASLTEGVLSSQPYVALKRAQLLELLYKRVSAQGYKVDFNTWPENIVQSASTSVVTFNNQQQETFDLIIATDGINSDTRNQLAGKPPVSNLGVTNWRFCVKWPNHQMQPRYMLGNADAFMFYPISNSELYCYAQITDKEQRYQNLDAKTAMRQVFADYSQEVNTAIEQAEHIHTGQLESVSEQKFSVHNALFVGDSLHGCPPSLQQGVAMILEDIKVLADLLPVKTDPQEIINLYTEIRRERVKWVVDESCKIIRLANLGNSAVGRFVRNSIVRLTGPQNVIGWKKLAGNKIGINPYLPEMRACK